MSQTCADVGRGKSALAALVLRAKLESPTIVPSVSAPARQPNLDRVPSPSHVLEFPH